MLNREYNKRYGKPLVFLCPGCGAVKRFGQWVKSELTYEQIEERYEIVPTQICVNCEKAFHNER